MFMVIKRNSDLKSKGVSDGSHQKLCTDKADCTSPTPDFCSIKCACHVAAKEDRDVGTADLPGFFLQTEADEDE